MSESQKKLVLCLKLYNKKETFGYTFQRFFPPSILTTKSNVDLTCFKQSWQNIKYLPGFWEGGKTLTFHKPTSSPWVIDVSRVLVQLLILGAYWIQVLCGSGRKIWNWNIVLTHVLLWSCMDRILHKRTLYIKTLFFSFKEAKFYIAILVKWSEGIQN